MAAKRLEDALNNILRDVKARFTYVSDAYQFGKREHWVEPERTVGYFQGDCEDFALACRAVCREQGIATRLMHCTTETNEPHCVLEASGWILDNRHSWVKSNADLPYTWNAISGYELGDEWHRLID